MKNKTKLFIAGLAALSLIGGITASVGAPHFSMDIAQVRAAVEKTATFNFTNTSMVSETPSTSSLVFTTNGATFDIAKGTSTTSVINYYPGTPNKTYSSTRMYKNSVLTISVASGNTLGSIEITAGSESYATALAGSTWTGATASASGNIVTVTPSAGTTNSISATLGGTVGVTAAEVAYTDNSVTQIDITAITAATLSATTVNLPNGDSATGITASATIAPEGANEAVKWSSSNTNVATIDATGAITVVAPGTCHFTASNTAGTITKDTADFTIIGFEEPSIVGSADSRIPLADVIANTDGNGAKKFVTTGVIKGWGKTGNDENGGVYGNFILTDGTNDVFVYGASANANASKFNPLTGKYEFNNPKSFLTNGGTKNLKVGDRVYMEAFRCDLGDTKELTGVITGSVTEELTSVTATLAKNSFTQGDALTADDFSNIVANYVVAGAKNISFADVTVSPERFTESGPQNVTVTYQGVTSAPIAVNVASAEIAITGIELNKTSHTLMGVGDTVKLIPTISPANATEKGHWIIEEGEDYVSIDEETGVVTATKVGGSATVFYYNDEENIGASCTIDVHETIELTRTDTLTKDLTHTDSTAYADWSGVTLGNAVYAGNSGASNSSIQLRSDNSVASAGVIVTESVGRVRRVTVVWNSNTADGRTIQVYGSHSAYSATSALYADDTKGTLLGTIVKGTSTELVIEGDYEYIGLRSASGALYATSIAIEWDASANGEDAIALDGFMKDKLHMSANVEGQCTGYYADAKAGYAALNRKQKVLLANSTYCTDAYARLVAWAAANGETINSKTLVLGANRIDSFLSDDSNGIALASIALMGGLVAGGAMLLRKKKEEK